MNVSVIIVNYNTKQLLSDCLSSIFKQTRDVSFEVIVSDNGSTDGSIEMIRTHFPQVILIENNDNLGFGKANNVAAEVAKGKYLFFLNSDTLFLNNALKLFWDEAERLHSDEIHYFLGSLLSDAYGNIVHSYEVFTSPLKGMFRCVVQTYPELADISKLLRIKKNNSVNNPFMSKEVQFIIGADLFVLASDFRLLNGFDESFFMYSEDEDLCRRAKKKGIICYIFSLPKIVHLESRSTKVKSKKIQFFEKSFLIYAHRYYHSFVFFVIWLFLFIYSLFRLLDFRFTVKERFMLLENIFSFKGKR